MTTQTTQTAAATTSKPPSRPPTPPPPRPRMELDDLASAAMHRRTLLRFCSVPCATHEARAGLPCWTIPAGAPEVARMEHIAVCGPRISDQRRREARGMGRASR